MTKILLLAIILTGIPLAQNISELARNVPREVQEIIDKEMSGNGYFLRSHNAAAVFKAGDPFLKCWLSIDSIRKYNENTPISKLITPYYPNSSHLIGEWVVPLFKNNTITHYLSISKYDSLPDQDDTVKKYYKDGLWHSGPFGGGPVKDAVWEKVIKKWPPLKGYHPVLIELYPAGRRFVYIPEQNDNNLTYLLLNQNDSLSMFTDSSFSTLSDSRIVLKFIKDHLNKRGLLNKKLQ